MRSVTVVIPGKPQAWQRAGENGKQHFTKPETKAFKTDVALRARAEMRGLKPFETALIAEVLIQREIPKSWSGIKKTAARTGAIKPTSRPDVDNYIKGVLDAMNGIVFNDDAQVTDLNVRKRYGDPLVVCTVKELD